MSTRDGTDSESYRRGASQPGPLEREPSLGADPPERRPARSKPAAAVSKGRRLAQRLGAPLIVFIVIAVLFALQNVSRVTISFWTVKVTSPLWIALYFWLIVGAVVGYIVARSATRRSRR